MKYKSLYLILLLFLLNINVLAIDQTLIVIGLKDNYPYEFINSNGEVNGFYNDILKSFAKTNNYKIDYKLYSKKEIESILKKNEPYDIITYTDIGKSLLKNYYLSETVDSIKYYAFIKSKFNFINSIDDIRGYSIGCLDRIRSDSKKYFNSKIRSFIQYNSIDKLKLDMENKRIRIIITDPNWFISKYSKIDFLSKLHQSSKPLYSSNINFLIKKIK